MLRSIIVKSVGNLLEAQHVVVRLLARLHLGRSSNVVKVDFDLGAFLDLLHALLHFRSNFRIGTVDWESSLGTTRRAVLVRNSMSRRQDVAAKLTRPGAREMLTSHW